MSKRHTLDDRRERKNRRGRRRPDLRYPVISAVPGPRGDARAAAADAAQRTRGHGMDARQWAQSFRDGTRRLVEDFNKRGRR